MRTVRRERLVGLLGALEGVAEAVEHLLAYLRTTERLLLVQAGRIGPTLLGGIESAAERLRDRDRLRAAAVVTLLTGDAGPSPAPRPSAGAVAEAPWDRAVEQRVHHLEELVAEIDRTATSLKRLSRRPGAVTGGAREVESAHALLSDALVQGLEELVPSGLRSFLAATGPAGRRYTGSKAVHRAQSRCADRA